MHVMYGEMPPKNHSAVEPHWLPDVWSHQSAMLIQISSYDYKSNANAAVKPVPSNGTTNQQILPYSTTFQQDPI